MRYLVTGGAGFIGSALVERLCSDGHEVRVLDDMSRGNPERLAGVPCEIAYGDVRDPGAVTRAMHGCEAVVHAAYVNGTQTFYAEPRHVLDVALHGILNVLAACEVTGCGQLLLISSSEAYQQAAKIPTPETVPLAVPDLLNPRCSYGGGKIAAELAALAWQRTGVLDRLVIVRPHNIYGPDMGREHVIPEFCLRMNTLIAEGWGRDSTWQLAGRTEVIPAGALPFPIQGNGEETRAFCYIDDAVDQLALLLGPEIPDGIWNVGTEDEITIEDVAREVAACYGQAIKVIPGTLARGSPAHRCPDMSKIRAAGYEGPRTPFADGVARTVAWYRADAA